MIASESELRAPSVNETRKKWGQSPRIQTVKGKRRRKHIRPKRRSKIHSSESEQKSSELDSDVYTTTDFEVEDTAVVKNTKQKQLVLGPQNILIKTESKTASSSDSGLSKGDLKIDINDDFKYNSDRRRIESDSEGVITMLFLGAIYLNMFFFTIQEKFMMAKFCFYLAIV